MKLFIDSANLAEIREALSWGLVDGVTTNPTLIAKERAEPTASSPRSAASSTGP